MRLNVEISDELRALSEVVAGITLVTPYEAPKDGYFETLPELIIRQIQRSADEPVLPLGLQSLTKKPALQDVPEGYFDNFAAQMLAKVKAGPRPEQSAAEELAALSPLLSKLGKKTPFEVPEGYFNQSITIPSIITGLQHKPTYQVPEGYFNTLAASILEKIASPARTAQTTRPEAPVIQMTNRPRTKQSIWWRIPTAAVAASVIIVVTLLTLPTFNTTKTSYSSTNSDITKNLTNTGAVSDQDLQNYLDDQDEHNAEQVINATALLDISETDVKSLLGEVSDAELREYMDDQKLADDLPTN